MRKIASNTLHQSGFTIIEIIVTLIVASILGTTLVQFMGSNLSASAENVSLVQEGLQLHEVMENITRDYRDWIQTSPDDLISVFAAAVNAAYADSIVAAETGIIDVDPVPANDDDIEILRVTIADGSQTMMALFTR